MFDSLAFYIGSRYTRAKKRNGFISFISLASMLGIALGVMVLITALSIMNGFNYEIKSRFFALMPEVTAMTASDIRNDWHDTIKQIETLPGVSGVAPFVTGKGIIMQNGQTFGVQVMGVVPGVEPQVSKLPQQMVAGTLSDLTDGSYNIVIGQELANSLGVMIGDKITLFTPQTSVTLAGVFPRYRRFTVSGIFHASDAFGFDMAYAFINMADAARVYPPGKGTSGFHIKTQNMYQVGQIGDAVQRLLPGDYTITDWTQTNGAFFQALFMEKTILYVVLLLIIAVAAFNLVATLVMVVNDKRADIAILRTLGATPGTILRTFIVQGLIVGVLGTLIGLATGLLLAYYATAIVNWYQHTFHIQLLHASVVFVDFLPSRIEAADVVSVAIIAVVLSLIAALYPAWLAFKTQPAEALRYE